MSGPAAIHNETRQQDGARDRDTTIAASATAAPVRMLDKVS